MNLKIRKLKDIVKFARCNKRRKCQYNKKFNKDATEILKRAREEFTFHYVWT